MRAVQAPIVDSLHVGFSVTETAVDHGSSIQEVVLDG